jgi:hypothetical protein
MGRIELIINSTKVKKNNEFREHLIKQKNDGEKLACIQLPNDDDIPILAFKANLWSDEEKCIHSYPIAESNIENLEEAIKNSDLTKTNLSNEEERVRNKLRDFNDVTTNGIDCPYCKEKLKQNRWFTNGK